MAIPSHMTYLLTAIAALVIAPLGLARVGAGELTVTPQQIQALQITLDEVKHATTEAVAVLPATVIPPPTGRHAVAAPFAGTVLHSSILIGQHVKKGQDLVSIASRDLLEALSRLKQSEAEQIAADVVAERYRYLADRDITSRNRSDETAALAAKARAVVEHNRRLTTINNIKVAADGSYILTAPVEGRVVEARVAPGTSLDAMAAPIVIDSTDAVWLEAQVPASLIKSIRPGDTISVANNIAGRVISIGGVLDPMTRSAMMLVELAPGSSLVAGQLVTLSVAHEANESALSVPRSAVSVIAGQSVVYVRTDDGFTPTPVTVRGRSTESATVEGALKPGQKVAISGLAQLEKMQARE
ncbi:MAG: efflux RND transporter periplasmic adaptor subunit [Proteobacteria bacterium]|nr:efflux RND transporter periplasmic adaptor subunit [Pseudomonadota bacterium]